MQLSRVAPSPTAMPDLARLDQCITNHRDTLNALLVSTTYNRYIVVITTITNNNITHSIPPLYTATPPKRCSNRVKRHSPVPRSLPLTSNLWLLAACCCSYNLYQVCMPSKRLPWNGPPDVLAPHDLLFLLLVAPSHGSDETSSHSKSLESQHPAGKEKQVG